MSDGGAGTSSAANAVVLHTSWRGRVLFVTAPLLLAGLGLYGIVAGGFQVFNTLLFIIGCLLLAAALFDFPLYTTIGTDGVVRRCLVRTDRLGWDQVTAIARPASRGALGGLKNGLGITNSTGLVVEIGKRPAMLVDRIESPAEFDAVKNGLDQWVPGMILRASRPADGTAPTWLYKRRLGGGEGLIDAIQEDVG